MNQLELWLQNEIREKGPLSFREFMHWALYHPDWGYYTGDKLPFGKEGDFYTSPGVHAVYGETLARSLYQKWKDLNFPSPFTVVEYGAGQGILARDILSAVQRMHPDLDAVLEYRIIEISERLQQTQRFALQNFQVQWVTRLADVGPFRGAVLSNELIDAFPVHIIKRAELGYQELFVSSAGGRLTEHWEPVRESRILLELSDWASQPVIGQQVEVNLDAMDWLTEISSFLQQGYVMTIDYGDEIPYLFEGKRKGTIRAYRHHQVIEDVLSLPGEQDLTADVNFTAFMRHGERVGLETFFFGTQSKFLIESGILESLSAVQPGTDPFHDANVKRNLAIKHFILPGGMGERFKVLIQRKIGV
jgi:SAM-dependent MidA family methyltransferase